MSSVERKKNGRSIVLRDIEVEDAQFVLSLRTNTLRNKFLNKTETDLESQERYIQNYKNSNAQWYFIIESTAEELYGTVRIYDIQEDSFCWGSWILKEEVPSYVAIESALCLYEYAFFKLGFKKSHFDVRQGNEKVLAFHKRLGAVVTHETEEDVFFSYTLEQYLLVRPKYEKFLP
jgi:RimJ/RimL family protein N-acetyltransferase